MAHRHPDLRQGYLLRRVYPGVDLVFYGNQRQLEYDFIVGPGADPSGILWRIEGARASADAEGNLTLRAPSGTATFRKPVVYQMEGARRRTSTAPSR